VSKEIVKDWNGHLTRYPHTLAAMCLIPVRRNTLQQFGWIVGSNVTVWGALGGREPGPTAGSRHGVGDLFTALRRQGLIADELVLQLATFLRPLDLFLELIVLAPRTLTGNQVRLGGKQGTGNPEHSRIHSSTCAALTSLQRSFPAQRLKHVLKNVLPSGL
jgi:hypothetical protein